MEPTVHNEIVDPQRYWLDHIQRCGEREQSLAEYAKTHHLKVTKLYYWNKRLKALGMLPTEPSAVSFKAVQIAQPTKTTIAACRLRFPNGLVMEWESALDGVTLEQLLSTVHRLA